MPDDVHEVFSIQTVIVKIVLQSLDDYYNYAETCIVP